MKTLLLIFFFCLSSLPAFGTVKISIHPGAAFFAEGMGLCGLIDLTYGFSEDGPFFGLEGFADSFNTGSAAMVSLAGGLKAGWALHVINRNFLF